MKSIQSILLTALLAALVLTASGSAAAQASDSTGRQRTDFTDVLSVPGFDASLGELAMVQLSLAGSFDGRVLRIVNQSGGTANFTVETRVRLCAQPAGAGTPSYDDCAATPSAPTILFDAPVVQESFPALPAGATGASEDASTAADATTANVLDPGALATFVGVGSVDYDVVTLAGFRAIGGGGNSTVEVETYANVTLDVVYDYVALDLVKLTNGVETASVAPGGAVEWTYDVTNTGNSPVVGTVVVDDREGEICTIAALAPGATERCTHTGVAGDQPYTNVAVATGAAGVNPGVPVSAEDTSGYVVAAPAPNPTPTLPPAEGPTPLPTPEPSRAPVFDNPVVDIEFHTNGVDADLPTGPVLDVGDPITWTYIVTNTGTVDLVDLIVTDDRLGGVCTREYLAIAERFECTRTGSASLGQDRREATVTGVSPAGDPATDRDPTHHLGGDEVAGLVATPEANPVANPVPGQELAITGSRSDGPAAIAMVLSALGLVLFSASEALHRRHRSDADSAESTEKE